MKDARDPISLDATWDVVAGMVRDARDPIRHGVAVGRALGAVLDLCAGSGPVSSSELGAVMGALRDGAAGARALHDQFRTQEARWTVGDGFEAERRIRHESAGAGVLVTDALVRLLPSIAWVLGKVAR